VSINNPLKIAKQLLRFDEAHAAWLVKWIYLAPPSGYTTYGGRAVCLEIAMPIQYELRRLFHLMNI